MHVNYTWDNNLKMSQVPIKLTQELWPNFMVEESDICEEQIVFNMSESEFNQKFPVWGLRSVMSNEVVAYISAVKLHVDLSDTNLPDEGWSFAANSYSDKRKSNCICLLVANVDKSLRKSGLSKILIEKAKVESFRNGFKHIIAPVRPTKKLQFPSLSMTEYLQMRTDNGEYYDPWIQTHVSLGAHILNICEKSVIIKASIQRWQKWTGIQFVKSGSYLVPGGLAPLSIDIDKNIGIYTEPNLWVRYDL